MTVAANGGRVHILRLLVEKYNGNLFHVDAAGVKLLQYTLPVL